MSNTIYLTRFQRQAKATQRLATAKQILLGKPDTAYLRQRLLQPLGLTATPSLQGKLVFEANTQGDILFNYFDIQGQPISYQVRRLSPQSLKAQHRKNKYDNPAGKEIQPYLVPTLLFPNLPKTTQYLIEGQIKSLIATQQLQLPFVGISGIEAGVGQKKNKSLATWEEDNFSFSPLLLTYLQQNEVHEVVFVHDADVFCNLDKPHRAASFSRAIQKYTLLSSELPQLKNLWYAHIHPRYAQSAKGLDDLLELFPHAAETIKHQVTEKISGGYFMFYDLLDKKALNTLLYQLAQSSLPKPICESHQFTTNKIGQDTQLVQHLIDYAHSSQPMHRFLQIVAGTGDGKTTVFLQQVIPSLVNAGQQVILAVPLVSLAEQLYANLQTQANTNLPTAYLVTGTTTTPDLASAHTGQFVIATYDSLPKLHKWFTSDTVLLIDEVHCLQECQNYRKTALDNLLGLFPLVKKVIGLTGTPLAIEGFTTIHLQAAHTQPIIVHPIEVPISTTYKHQVASLLPDLLKVDNQLVVVKVDDSELLTEWADYLCQSQIIEPQEICKLYNKALDHPAYRQLIETGTLADNIRLVLTTSKIEMGVSIYTNKKVTQVIISEKSVRDFVQQVNRFRTYQGQLTVFNLRKSDSTPTSTSFVKFLQDQQKCVAHLQQEVGRYIQTIADETLHSLAIRQTDMKPFVVADYEQRLYRNDFAIQWYVENLPQFIPSPDQFYAILCTHYPHFRIKNLTTLSQQTVCKQLLGQVHAQQKANKAQQKQAFEILCNEITPRGVLEYVYVTTHHVKLRNQLQTTLGLHPEQHNTLTLATTLEKYPHAAGVYADKWATYFLKLKIYSALPDDTIAELLAQTALTNYNVGKLIKTLQTQQLITLGEVAATGQPIAKDLCYQAQLINQDKERIATLCQQTNTPLTLTMLRKTLNQKGKTKRSKPIGSNKECKAYLQTLYEVTERKGVIMIGEEKTLAKWCEQWGVDKDDLTQKLLQRSKPQPRKQAQTRPTTEPSDENRAYEYKIEVPF